MTEFLPKKTLAEIKNHLNEKGFDGLDDMGEVKLSGAGKENWVYNIYATGDWKHTHGWLDWLMWEIGYVSIGEQDIYNPDYEGSDFGQMVHRYMWKTAADIFHIPYQKLEEE